VSRNPLVRFINLLSMREREVRDSLWLFACMLLVCAPLFVELPLWIVAGFLALLAWRTRIAWLGRRLPPRVLLIALLLVSGGGVFLQYHTVVGKDAGVAYIVLLLGLKLMELRARRDVFVVVYLCLFIMLTTLFDNQTMFNAAWLIVDVVFLTTALIRVAFGTSDPPMRVKIKLALQMTGFAIPLMVVLFVLFPRVSGPLWGLPSDAFTGMTGLSETMSPGSFSQMAQSDEVAFEVKFKNRVPPAQRRYWRGPVLSYFDGRSWRPGGFSAEALPQLDIEANPATEVEYTQTLEPSNRPWLLLLDAPADRPFVPGQSVTLRADLQATIDTPVRERMRFDARGYFEYRYGGNETPGRLASFRQVPRNTNPRLLAYANELHAKYPEAKDLVAAVLSQIHSENFYYTLSPPLYQGRDSLDQFFFDSRRGFCEHYASATAVLLRDAGIPARVVTGYLGGEINPVNGFVVLRQRDAHAWVEYWSSAEGWSRVDPTAAIASERIDNELLPQSDPVQSPAGDFTQSNLSVLRYVRLHMDAMKIAWDQFVVGYSGDEQAGLLSRFGIPQLDWQALTIGLGVAFSLVLAVIAGQLLVTREKPEPVVRIYQKLCRELARVGIVRAANEGPRDLATRAAGRLTGAGREAVLAALAQYQRVRYSKGAAAEPGALAEFKRLVRRVSRTSLKS
jgi:transglutaminase-like putative cysteine protease